MTSLTRRDFLKLGGLTMLAAAFRQRKPLLSTTHEQPILYQGSPAYSNVALTYDDCNSITGLHRLEDILNQHPQARVTLFAVGETFLNNERKDPGVWKRYYEKGHEIGYHSYDHTNPEVMSAEKLLQDYDHWLNDLSEVLGVEPVVRFARPPFGNTSKSFLALCAARGLVPTMWSTGWGGPTESVVDYTVPKIHAGDIVLMHSDRLDEDIKTTEKALPKLEILSIHPVTITRLYIDLLKEQNQSAGCNVSIPSSLTRTCIE